MRQKNNNFENATELPSSYLKNAAIALTKKTHF